MTIYYNYITYQYHIIISCQYHNIILNSIYIYLATSCINKITWIEISIKHPRLSLNYKLRDILNIIIYWLFDVSHCWACPRLFHPCLCHAFLRHTSTFIQSHSSDALCVRECMAVHGCRGCLRGTRTYGCAEWLICESRSRRPLVPVHMDMRFMCDNNRRSRTVDRR